MNWERSHVGDLGAQGHDFASRSLLYLLKDKKTLPDHPIQNCLPYGSGCS